MPPLAQRNLFHDKVRLTVTLTGIVFSVVLIVVQLGLFIGFTTATSNLIDHSGADLWITSKNVPYVEQGVAFSERKLNQVRAVEGVADAQKIIARWTQWKRHDGGQDSVQIVGINVDDRMEQPWNLVEGRVEDLKSPDAVILDELYKQGDPSDAATQFREVLARNPEHYGATLQLAKALDRAGKPEEALPIWRRMQAMAEAIGDAETIQTVRARLADAHQ